MALRYIKDVDVRGKVLLLRAGLDLPVKNGKIEITRRLAEQAKAIKQLSYRGARVVILSHQGRPGKKNFLSMEQHANAIAEEIGLTVPFLGWDSNLEEKIPLMQDGDVLMLDNVRALPDEMIDGANSAQYANTEFVQRLSKLADYYVNNAFSVSHRKQASMVGFPLVMPSYAGTTLKMELDALDKAMQNPSPRVFIIGGIKTKDSIKITKFMLEKNLVDKVLLGGLMGELFVKASGITLGAKEQILKSMEFFEYIKPAKELLATYKNKLVLPTDLGCANDKGERVDVKVSALPTNYMIKDIGQETALKFFNLASSAKTVIWEGPLGVYEEKQFIKGTSKVAQAITFSESYSVLAGGETESAINKAGFSLDKFSHVSLAGKACMLYLAGEPLAALKAMEEG